MGSLFVGVDGGGTHTRAVVGRPGGVVLGRGEAGASNPSALGFEAALAAIVAAIEAALAEAGFAADPATAQAAQGPGDDRIEAVAMGVAGAGRPADRARLAAMLAARPGMPADVRVLQDVALLLPAAGLSSGVALVAGTGSSAFGVAPDGRTTTAGGWGYLLGDEGSAFAVGRAALRAVGHAADGHGAPTALTDLVTRHLGLAHPRDLITAVYQAASPRMAVADLAPLVARAAAERDELARSILAANGADLARDGVAVARALGLPPGAPVVGVGGMLSSGDVFLASLRAGLTAGGLGDFHPLEAEPALGALRLATGEVPLPRMD
jgi:N-acetylglucosamine kinase-like BadF-type ATPase